ncbi:DNA-binding response regulator [Fischerella thermalis CCMEE 5273]|nr:DNA-binding response regulator [Fischerella thermalis CCMEE 5273]
MIQVLIADDDPNIRELIRLYILREGYQVLEAADGQEAIEMMLDKKIDLAIVDIMMPNLDGWQLTEEMRSFSDIPVLMISAKGEVADRIRGFQAGTDDYLVKPFDPQELIMRVNALLRRYKQTKMDQLTIGDTVIDRKRKTIASGDREMILGVKEFDILYMLAGQPGQIFSRDQIIDEVWGYDTDRDERTVDVHIRRLRKKTAVFPEIMITTVRNVGYKLEAKR